MINKLKTKKRIFRPAIFILILAGVAVNVFLSMLIRGTSLPFYIDTVGTITVTALGGIIPGLITAFLTNAINFFMDGESIFYAPLNMIIAVVAAAFFGNRALFKREETKDNKIEKRVIDILLFIFVIAIIGGGIGAEITWYLYRTPSDNPMIVYFSEIFAKTLHFNVWGCHMASTFITDLMDKTITVAISLLIVAFMPKKVKEMVRVSPWRQKQLSFNEQKEIKQKLISKVSVGTKINLIIVVSIVFMTIVVSVFSLINFRQNATEWLSENAAQVAYLASLEIDPDKVDAFIENGEDEPGYIETKNRLIAIKNSSSTVAFLYVYQFHEDGCHVVFDLDNTISSGRFVKGYEPGEIVDFEPEYEEFLDDLLAGKEIQPIKIDDEYGSFLAVYQPVYNEEGKCVCYAVSNIETTLITEYTKNFFGRVFLLFSAFFIFIIIFSILMTKYNIVMPILSMTAYTNKFVGAKHNINEENLKEIEKLDIRTNDEIELLFKTLCKLTNDTVSQLNDIENKSESITKMQSGLIITMADMVENRDSDTGAHVLKTAAYVRIILQGLKKKGYYAEKLTDKYMADVEMSAPLHDVGKINISDTILNKPGKLTDEEFAIMKTHTIHGKHIIEKAIATMEGDNYLKEARNMAAYHHERWDGKGYPENLHGEIIPLSARVMAVADVFDALASKRVYKPAFPLEEALKIIEEGAGTQFDPKCVEVFLEAVPEIKEILRKYDKT